MSLSQYWISSSWEPTGSSQPMGCSGGPSAARRARPVAPPAAPPSARSAGPRPGSRCRRRCQHGCFHQTGSWIPRQSFRGSAQEVCVVCTDPRRGSCELRQPELGRTSCGGCTPCWRKRCRKLEPAEGGVRCRASSRCSFLKRRFMCRQSTAMAAS